MAINEANAIPDNEIDLSEIPEISNLFGESISAEYGEFLLGKYLHWSALIV